MKNIQLINKIENTKLILKEMEELSIAVSSNTTYEEAMTNNTYEDELRSLIVEASIDVQPGNNHICSNKISFCCKVPISMDFVINLIPSTKKIAFNSNLLCYRDPNKVRCQVIINQCPSLATVELYKINIFGSLSYSVNITGISSQCAFEGETLTPSIDKTTVICCQDTLAINNTVNFTNEAPCILPDCDGCTTSPTPVTCDRITVEGFTVTTENCNGKNYVVFQGNFVLPTNCIELP